MSINVHRFKTIKECKNPDRLQFLFDTFNDEGALKVLRRHWMKLNHRLFDNTLECDLAKVYKFGKALTEDRFILFWGRTEGIKQWESYCQKQSITNSLKYKNEKYSMTKEEFSAYNKSRAVTLKNQIEKYGIEEGTNRYNSYCTLQKYVGSSKEYFIDKYGEDGIAIWKDINFRKSHTLESYLLKYKSLDVAQEKLTEYFSKNHSAYVSKSGNAFCEALYNSISYMDLDCRFASKDKKEFGIMDVHTKKYYMYDFVLVDICLIIEYNGDYYHANPEAYSKNDIMYNGLYASDIWRSDHNKIKCAESRNFSVITVWESDYKRDPIGKIDELKSIIEHHRKLHS